MPRKFHNALTPITVRNACPGRHADGGGLYLRVQDGGARSWLFRSTAGGKARDIGLGPAAGAGAIALADARAMARELSTQAAKGEALEGKRTKARKAAAEGQAEALTRRTFRDVAEAFIDRKEGGWRNEKHRQQWRNTLATYVYPIIGDLPVSLIRTDHVLKVLEPIWSDKPETASRVRGRIENVLSAAKVQGMRFGENPALWRGHLDHILPKPGKLNRGHHAALAYGELPAFMADLRAREALAARALEFAILTAARTGEVIGATWSEIDLAGAVWTVPASRMKAGKEHSVPLSKRALAILEAVLPLNTAGRADAPLFPAHDGDALSGMAMSMLIRRMHKTEQAEGRTGWIDRKEGGRLITSHGFRSTFRDWAGERSTFPREVIEHAMAHQLPDKAEASYARASLLPRRVKLMDAWAEYCATPLATGSTVTPIRAEA
ncbi:bacteriophage P4 integrase [Novosphingobium sediminis]|uniref:Bacteriophage P4 integrase n=1 Tax=Novosphingobium sediminis TaxID=707214 RepID=A0A512ANC5_9SPHN|nr:site-specific integrase [Novosphingobium sediminis]GEO01186.1 bacteriophage P4 integrase [Novosphingobium sediminis]